MSIEELESKLKEAEAAYADTREKIVAAEKASAEAKQLVAELVSQKADIGSALMGLRSKVKKARREAAAKK